METSVRVLVANRPRLFRGLVMSTRSEKEGVSIVGEAENENSEFCAGLRWRFIRQRRKRAKTRCWSDARQTDADVGRSILMRTNSSAGSAGTIACSGL